MKIIQTVTGYDYFRGNNVPSDKKIGFVPTMGALHEGHLSLIDKAAEITDVVVVSIFVNPNQFNDPNDLKNYPRNVDVDIKLLSGRKVDVLFVPGVDDVYPAIDTRKFDFGSLESVMEGKHRPGHFNGVAQVVSRLFDIIKPHKAFFGQKDFQQVAIIRELVKQLNFNIEIITCPTIREKGGLAMSSRNQLLSETEKKHAEKIYKTLKKAKKKKEKMEIEELEKWAVEKLNKDPLLDVEYFNVVNPENLQKSKKWGKPGENVACVAVKIGSIRLIDNIFFD